MLLGNKHKLGAVVYLLTDSEQEKRVVTAITVRSGGYLVYELSCGTECTNHVETEIVKEKSYIG